MAIPFAYYSHGVRRFSCLGTLTLLLLLPMLASAQTNGLISGTVTDKTGPQWSAHRWLSPALAAT